ncbi:ABC transporter permease subunit [Humisphaera borealis]|uniref:ABC transporter permease subunit n=2 Tax=Humisphaera borealis TaxID=2807512 RepID=A0A7M2X5H3_9BACT|nr:ABC transporter permease subunit [Humisphaera borealis]
MSRVRVYLRTIEGQYIPAQRGAANKPINATHAGKVRLIDVQPGVTVAPDGAAQVLFYSGSRRPTVEVLDATGKVVETHAVWPNGVIEVKDGQEVTAGDTLARQANPLQVSQVVRAYQPNAQSQGEKTASYFSRWWEFLSDDPREANTEGGVFPAIVGTVLMTFVMIIFVVPIGVIAAIYLREYAKQGLLVTIIRISVNNLAGVPSIVFGVFGLAFFCYGLGKWIDSGPAKPIPQGQWFAMVAVIAAMVIGALLLSFLASTHSKDEKQSFATALRWGGILLWVTSAILVFVAVSGMPFFKGFFWVEASENTPVVGKSALIWASLTLALLTLPVVIVATEEALSAVPRSMREGSYACGASKWQTIRRIVLPRALPGIMTGMILAVARGAGEVAPLMLVGAVKLAPELPLSARFPFFGSDRSFMHLGFHIYDLGFQSPDSENARPLVYTTTFLLIAIVMLLNFSAMLIRSRLRKAHASGAF